jgi:hypothetical protein
MTIFNRYARWRRRGVWLRIVTAMLEPGNFTNIERIQTTRSGRSADARSHRTQSSPRGSLLALREGDSEYIYCVWFSTCQLLVSCLAEQRRWLIEHRGDGRPSGESAALLGRIGDLRDVALLCARVSRRFPGHRLAAELEGVGVQLADEAQQIEAALTLCQAQDLG